MEVSAGSRHHRSREHRGARNLLTLAARLPPWACDLYNLRKQVACPRQLRRIRGSLRELIVLLETHLAQLESAEHTSDLPVDWP